MARRRRKVSRSSGRRRAPVKIFGFSLSRTIAVILPILALVYLVNLNNQTHQIGQVLGTATQSFGSGVVSWNTVSGAAGYNIYYKQQNEGVYTHAVRDLPSTSTRYTITFLKKSTGYKCIVTAYDSSGKECWFSSPRWILKLN